MTDTPHADLLSDIRAFCASRGIKPTRFGELALNDTRLVSDLEKGRQLLPKTVAKVQGYMAGHRTSEAEGRAA